MAFDHKQVETKWQAYWDKHQTYFTDVYDFSKPKFYALNMFPYPSGQGLHVGHPRSYTATDVVARLKKLQGFNVLNPMGWDSFGLPAEQFALKTNQHPSTFTYENIANFKRQLKALGYSFDWTKEVATTDPLYYQWTQWIFLKFYEKGLAYIEEKPVNFCPALGTVLANEEVIDGKSEVGGFPVERKMMKQWVLKITAYADALLEGLSELDWPNSTRDMQTNWIGKSLGTEIEFSMQGMNGSFKVFTTRVDTLFGCTYCVLAPEHPLVRSITISSQRDEVEHYIKQVATKSDLDRTELNKEKSGVFTGAFALHPLTQKLIPIWIADYVLYGYGTGAVMAVPAHDERDYVFAKKYYLPIVQVLEGDVSQNAYTLDGKHIHSDFINGLLIEPAKQRLTDYLVKLGKGKAVVNYKLRDWLFSRQRYWGEPIPVMISNLDGSIKPLTLNDLPLRLPELKEYKPSGSGESPLSLAHDWLQVKVGNQTYTRETNTMPQWAGSCWYYIRYLDPKNTQALADERLIEHWLPVDLYIGGAEHAVLHLLYARFYHKFLFDIGVVKTKEPFKKLFHQGMILGENGEKMSKSRGIVVNPDDIIEQYGADTLRLFEMFMGPLEASLPWSNQGLEGARRFLDRVYRFYTETDYRQKWTSDKKAQVSLSFAYHSLVKKVTKDFESLQLNTAISQFMIFMNEAYKAEQIFQPYMESFLVMLSCLAPHISEELWSILGHKTSITQATWPTWDEQQLIQSTVEMAISVNGKLRSTLTLAIDSPDEFVIQSALSMPVIQKQLEGKKIIKTIVVKNKILNIVVV